MRHTRRRALQIGALATGGALVGGALATGWLHAAAADRYRRLVELPKTPPAPLDAHTVEALRQVTAALLVEGIDESRYEDFFRWKAENAAGYAALYTRLARALDAEARLAGAQSFAAATRAQRHEALAKARGVRAMINTNDRTAGAWYMLFERDWLLFERYVVRELLTLFAKTDAWVLSGYGQPPGVPRTIDSYLVPPTGAPEVP
ncbi:hypothetical protein L6R52_10395 [Myxococcota bacterium]|nr:hypothetical protein [Myxococcota bacterium]